MAHILGTHAVRKGGVEMAIRRAAAAGMDAVQIFTAIPKFYGDRSSVSEARQQRYWKAIEDTGMPSENVLVHGAYVLNTASDDETKWGRAAGGLAMEMKRSNTLRVRGACFHPGSSTDPPERAAGRVAEAMTRALRGSEGPAKLYVENAAGAGSTFGKTAEEVGLILSMVGDDVRERAGYGLDTCHLYASGYDIAASPAVLSGVLDAFEEAAGEPPSFFHLNDSVGTLGSNLDRHALIGEGEIGEEAFGWLLEDERSHGVLLILETPQKNEDIDDDDASADPWDVRMRETLERLGAELSGRGA